MNALYLIGILILLILFGYPYLLLIKANKEKGFIKISGFILSATFVLVLFLLIILWQFGVVRMPNWRENMMPQRATPRMMHGWSEYMTGMMLENEEAIDAFIEALKSKPELYEKFKKKLK
ncbi:MAG: hypothetical protein ACP5QT_06950 [Brevinematia bacterium]